MRTEVRTGVSDGDWVEVTNLQIERRPRIDRSLEADQRLGEGDSRRSFDPCRRAPVEVDTRSGQAESRNGEPALPPAGSPKTRSDQPETLADRPRLAWAPPATALSAISSNRAIARQIWSGSRLVRIVLFGSNRQKLSKFIEFQRISLRSCILRFQPIKPRLGRFARVECIIARAQFRRSRG